MDRSLQGLRVADFSRILAGPLATMVLADLGADVTKIERPEIGDDTRSWGPPYDDRGVATYFSAINRNKNAVALDLRSPAGLARAREIVAGADVLVENFRPGVMERLGLDYETLRATHPGLIYCSITGFGAGAGADWPGYDLLVQALGGLMSITGDSDGEPQKVGVALVDVVCGLFATVGILAAVRHRDYSGRGQRVEVNLLSSLLAALVNQSSAFTLAGVVGARLGNAHPSIAPYELFRTLDGELVLAAGNDRQFASLCRIIGRPELARDERFAANADRVHNRLALREAVEQSLRKREAKAWVPDLMAAGVPAGEVNDIGGAFALAERLGLDPIVKVPRSDGSTASLPRNPIQLSQTPVTYRAAAPELPPIATRAGRSPPSMSFRSRRVRAPSAPVIASPRRASLVVPGSSSRMLDKARAIAVDELVIDLEDAVAKDAKAQARASAIAALSRGFAAGVVAVRVNAPGTAWAHEDLVALARAARPPHSVVVPKVESAADIAYVDALLDDGSERASGQTQPLRIQALVETPRGLRALAEIADASPRLESLILAYADLAASLGRSPAGAAELDLWLAIQDSVLSAARAAGLQAIDGPYLSITDECGLCAAATRAVDLGFDGKWVIHPSQLAVVTDAFTPRPEEVAHAQAILEALADAAAGQRGATSLEGDMLDEAVRLTALRTIARAEAARS